MWNYVIQFCMPIVIANTLDNKINICAEYPENNKQGRCSTESECFSDKNQEVGSQKDPMVLALEKLSEQLCKQQQTESELYTKIINQ